MMATKTPTVPEPLVEVEDLLTQLDTQAQGYLTTTGGAMITMVELDLKEIHLSTSRAIEEGLWTS
jgi:hypothetical protein